MLACLCTLFTKWIKSRETLRVSESDLNGSFKALSSKFTFEPTAKKTLLCLCPYKRTRACDSLFPQPQHEAIIWIRFKFNSERTESLSATSQNKRCCYLYSVEMRQTFNVTCLTVFVMQPLMC